MVPEQKDELKSADKDELLLETFVSLLLPLIILSNKVSEELAGDRA